MDHFIKKLIPTLVLLMYFILFLHLGSCDQEPRDGYARLLPLEFSELTPVNTGGFYHEAKMGKEGGEFTAICEGEDAEIAKIHRIEINGKYEREDEADSQTLYENWPYAPVVYSNREWGWAKSEYFESENLGTNTVHIFPNDTGKPRHFFFSFGCCTINYYLDLIQEGE